MKSWKILPLLVFVTGCEVGPDYSPPGAITSSVYKEGAWKVGEPQDAFSRGAWWSLYKDTTLNELESQVEISNQNLKASEAAYRQATAIVAESRAGYFPTLSLDGSGRRSGSIGNRNGNSVSTIVPTTTGAGATNSNINSTGTTGSSTVVGTTSGSKSQTIYNASAGASWDLDVWGRISRTVEGDIANAQASAADLASATLSAQTTLATDYFQLRTDDQQKHLLDETVKDYQQVLQITQNQYNAGIAAKADLIAAQTQLDLAEAQEINIGVQRSQLEHAIAVLIGKAPGDVTISPVSDFAVAVPEIPAGVPSTLLERRPDIAAAERRMASANAQIGVAEAAYYPDITLSGSYGYSGTNLGKLFNDYNNLWSYGATLSETLLDWGLRDAQVDQAQATYDQTVATYRQAALLGFQQVEDQLAALHILQQQSVVEAEAVKDSKEAEQLAVNQYKAGVVLFTSVITAQQNALSSEEGALSVYGNRLIASANLIAALGGGWDSSAIPTSAQIENNDSILTKKQDTALQDAGSQ